MSSPSPIQQLILCVDPDVSALRLLRSVLVAYDYGVLAVSSNKEAMRLASRHELNAVILTDTVAELALSEVVSEIKRMQPKIPILLFSASRKLSAADLVQVDALVDKADGTHALLPILQRLFQQTASALPVTRRFPRYRVQLPVMVTVDRAGKLAVLHGVCTSFGEGGIGGRIDGNLEPGECVLVLISDPRLEMPLEPRGQVRYRENDSYGFAFFDVTSSQRNDVRRFCRQLGYS